MEKKKEEKEAYATGDPTETTAKEQEDMAKEAIKKFKSLNWDKLSLAIVFSVEYGIIWIKRKSRRYQT